MGPSRFCMRLTRGSPTRPGYARYFSADLGEGRRRRATRSEVLIDLSGSKLVANFGTLQKVERDRDPPAVMHRKHEMILQRPFPDDPQITERQQTKVSEALQALEQQADQEELR